jgi:hypothetical protein
MKFNTPLALVIGALSLLSFTTEAKKEETCTPGQKRCRTYFPFFPIPLPHHMTKKHTDTHEPQYDALYDDASKDPYKPREWTQSCNTASRWDFVDMCEDGQACKS